MVKLRLSLLVYGWDEDVRAGTESASVGRWPRNPAKGTDLAAAVCPSAVIASAVCGRAAEERRVFRTSV